VLQTRRSSASSFKYPRFSLRPSSTYLRLLPRLPVTSSLLFIFPSITCFSREFLRDQSSQPSFFLLYIGYSPHPWLYAYFYISDMIGPTYLLHPSPAPHFKTVQAFLIYFPKCPLSRSKIFTLLRIRTLLASANVEVFETERKRFEEYAQSFPSYHTVSSPPCQQLAN